MYKDDVLNVSSDRDAELAVGSPRLRGQRSADAGAGRKPGILSQPVDPPPHCESHFTLNTADVTMTTKKTAAVTEEFLQQAIENFAMTVKTTAQMLQKFGTDLAETELPNDVQCTKDLLMEHTDKHNNLKVAHNHTAHGVPAHVDRFDSAQKHGAPC